MRVTFYAPLKPIDHPVPSGDRLMARGFFGLLEAAGHEVAVASRLRSFEKSGDRHRQLSVQAAAASEAAALIERYRAGSTPELWFTYHAYHKAPDWLGPAVSRELGIPYVVAEASIAGKQAGGPWDLGHRATIEAVAAASAVLALTRVDAENLAKYLNDPAKLVLFPPFLAARQCAAGGREAARRRLARALDLATDTVWLAVVAMMRNDIKADSYRLLADALARLTHSNWRLVVIGDGPAAAEIGGRLRAVAGTKLRLLGEQPPEAVAELLAAADIFAWPGLEEAYGMAVLEALAAGLPVVACAEGGIPDLVEPGRNGLLAADRSTAALAAHLDRLIGDAALRRRLGAGAVALVEERHSLAAARARLERVLTEVTSRGGEPCN